MLSVCGGNTRTCPGPCPHSLLPRVTRGSAEKVLSGGTTPPFCFQTPQDTPKGKKERKERKQRRKRKALTVQTGSPKQAFLPRGRSEGKSLHTGIFPGVGRRGLALLPAPPLPAALSTASHCSRPAREVHVIVSYAAPSRGLWLNLTGPKKPKVALTLLRMQGGDAGVPAGLAGPPELYSSHGAAAQDGAM